MRIDAGHEKYAKLRGPISANDFYLAERIYQVRGRFKCNAWARPKKPTQSEAHASSGENSRGKVPEVERNTAVKQWIDDYEPDHLYFDCAVPLSRRGQRPDRRGRDCRDQKPGAGEGCAGRGSGIGVI